MLVRLLAYHLVVGASIWAFGLPNAFLFRENLLVLEP